MPTESVRDLFPGDVLSASNLTASYSSLCLAGGAAGQTAMQGELAAFQFGSKSRNSLASLLPINGWDNGATELGRLVYFNTRFVVQFDAHRLLLEAFTRFFCSNFV